MREVSTKMGFVSPGWVLVGCAVLSACASGSRIRTVGDKDQDASMVAADGGDDAAVDEIDAAIADAGMDASDAQSGGEDAATDAGSDAGTSAFINPTPGSKLFLGANFWNIDWEGADNYFIPSVDWATTQNPWNPQFLADIGPYHVLRFMDWNLTNEEVNPQADWATRKLKTENQTTSPVAYEWQIDLCNRAKKDFWITVPHNATTSYMMKLATLIRDTLDPRLRVYVEWSNEVWNGAFPAREYSKAEGERLSLKGDDKGFAYQVYASVRMFEAFDAVFGEDKTRLVRVISGQAVNLGVCDIHIDAFSDNLINPNGSKPDVYAVAPYFMGANISELNGPGIDNAATWITDTYRCADRMDLKVIAYEAGQDSYVPAGGEMPCAEIQMQGDMRETYVSFLNAMKKAKLTGPLMQYTHTGNCWGMKQKTSDSTEASPKYRGMLDWLSQQK
jgi:hypothetical protein